MSRTTPTANRGTGDLDPVDWEEFRRDCHRAVDDMIDHLATLRERPVWQAAPAEIRRSFRDRCRAHPAHCPRSSTISPPGSSLTPPAMDIPRSWAGSTARERRSGMLAEMLAAGLNANCGGRNHIALDVERQIAAWAAQLFGFPDSASGLFVTGTSMANLRCPADRADRRARRQRSRNRVARSSPTCRLRFEGSAWLHRPGRRNLWHRRAAPASHSDRRPRRDAARSACRSDRGGSRSRLPVPGRRNRRYGEHRCDRPPSRAGRHLRAAALCGFMSTVRSAPCVRCRRPWPPLIAGIERAHSIAFDFHKSAHVPYDAGFVLVRDPEMQRRTFSNPASYLNRTPAGLAAGDVWPCDLGPDLSRGFRGLKTWFTFRVHGADRIGAPSRGPAGCEISGKRARQDRDVRTLCAGRTQHRVLRPKNLPGRPPQSVARHRFAGARARRALNDRPGRQDVIRAAIVNHRTTSADIDTFLDALHASALRVVAASGATDDPEPHSAFGR